MLSKSAIWFITGCSKGLGRQIAGTVLNNGWRAVVTARQVDSIKDFAQLYGDRVLIQRLDVNDAFQVKEGVGAAESHFGSVDVLVNNAGYGYIAAVEEGEDEEIRSIFETNVYGVVRMMQAVLPGMRHRGEGFIINISSIGGIITYPGLGYYNATKHAVEALSEALSQEIASLGIHVMIVEPGPLRTEWAGSSVRQSKLTIDDYANTAGASRKFILDTSGQQAGSPEQVAEIILRAIEAKTPPLRLVLGKDALDSARAKVELLQRDFNCWEKESREID